MTINRSILILAVMVGLLVGTSPALAAKSKRFVPFPNRHGIALDCPEVIDTQEDLTRALMAMREYGEDTHVFKGFNLKQENASTPMEGYCDIYSYEVSILPGRCELKVQWYPGTRIWQAVAWGRERKLSSDDAALLRRVRGILSQIVSDRMTDLQKERAIHDYICGNCVYAVDEKHRSTVDCYGVFMRQRAQCSGYADAFQLMCRLSDVWVCGAGGTILKSHDARTPQGMGHAWNLVWLDGKWYAVDVTWDDLAEGDLFHGYLNVPFIYLDSTRSFDVFALPKGDYATRLDANWGCWELPQLNSVADGAAKVVNHLMAGQTARFRLDEKVDASAIAQEVANNIMGSIMQTELLNESWARIVQFSIP